MESVNKLISGGRKQPCMDLNAIWTPCPRKSRTVQEKYSQTIGQ